MGQPLNRSSHMFGATFVVGAGVSVPPCTAIALTGATTETPFGLKYHVRPAQAADIPIGISDGPADGATKTAGQDVQCTMFYLGIVLGRAGSAQTIAAGKRVVVMGDNTGEFREAPAQGTASRIESPGVALTAAAAAGDAFAIGVLPATLTIA